MSSATPDPERHERALDLYADFLEQRESEETGDLEGLCRDHPELADDFRRLEADWRHVDALIGRLGIGSVTLRLVLD